MSFADDLVARHEPWLTPDLEDYLRAIATMFTQVELYAFDVVDEDGEITHEGWTILFDPDRAPAEALEYLAQVVGERLPVGIPEAAAREWIKDRPNSRRGTPRSIFLAAQRHLTGTRIVSMRERVDGIADQLTVATYAFQTPDSAQTLADIVSVVPADVILNYETRTGQSWRDVMDNNATWRDVMTAYASWGEVATDVVGENVFQRA